ncbi:UNVERIFIED_CONTAM: hypothetical protein NCL1_24965 [Trichonephila clavipes]
MMIKRMDKTQGAEVHIKKIQYFGPPGGEDEVSLQQQYSQNKSQVVPPSTALRHNYRCLKYTYIKVDSKAITRSLAEVIANRFNIQSNTH